MLERGLAYKRTSAVNWCPKEETVLSNEQSSGGICWRCGSPVTKKEIEQWYLRTTKYAEQLVKDIEEIESARFSIPASAKYWASMRDSLG